MQTISITQSTTMKQLLIAVAMFLSIDATAQTIQQCTAIAQAKARCTRAAMAGATTCKQHNPLTPHCGATTQAGTPCKITVKKAGQHCKRHTATK